METTAPPLEETWNLADLFADVAAFERAKQDFERDTLPLVDRDRGQLLVSARHLAEALAADARTIEALRRLQAFACLESDEDIRRAAGRARRQAIEVLATEVSKRRAFLRPEILSAEPGTIERWLAEEPALAEFAHSLHDLLRQREHVLSLAEEKIVAATGLVSGDASSLYGVLAHAELPRAEIALENGETVRLTTVAFQRHRATANRTDRLALFPRYFESYAAFQDTFGQNLYSAVKGHVFTARVRGYGSCLAAALHPDHIPETVYRNLIEQVRRRLPTLHRYFGLRARSLSLERLEYPDLYCPLSPVPPRRYSVTEAKRTVREAMRPLGEPYVEVLANAFESRWIDWHPAEGKRSGAYASGWAYAVHPYVLLNFNQDQESVSTLAHEMGHALHSYFSNRAQRFTNASYRIFVAEVASTFNEALLLRRMLDEASTPEERRSLVGSYLDGLRGTLFRQTMFAEFELEIHERVERGEVLTGEKLSEVYLELLRRYHGHDAGVVHIAERYAVEWAAIPHLYYDFYVYQYATGIVAAQALAHGVLGGEPGAVRRYLEFLAAGGSDYPLSILRAAGVDLERPDPFDRAFAAIDSRLDELELLLEPAPSRAR